jgi:hypothetical protein
MPSRPSALAGIIAILRHRVLGNPMAMSALPIEQALIESNVIADRIRKDEPLLPTMLAFSDIMSEIATNAVEREYWE